MAAQYFAVRPNAPICVLLFQNTASYRHWASRLFGDRDVSSYGYYKPALRTIVINGEHAESAIRHELTHALMAFDFPDAPDWLREGIASLHESSRMVQGGRKLEGTVNRRLPALQEAIRNGTLPPLDRLFNCNDFHGRSESLNYAQSRYFCLYLQQRGLLADLYRQFRIKAESERSAAESLVEVLPPGEYGRLDADFRRFALDLKMPSTTPCAPLLCKP
jgi:hypothetical protein